MIGQTKKQANLKKSALLPSAKHTSQNTDVLPSPEQGSSPSPPALMKRGRGRPRKTPEDRPARKPEEKALKTLTHVANDVLAAATFDGGGTPDDSPVVTKESLERRIARRLNVVDRYLSDERLAELLSISGLKEIGVYEGIMMDKALVIRGQPTVIVGSEDRTAMDTVLPKLINEMRRRKLITTVSERKMEFVSTEDT